MPIYCTVDIYEQYEDIFKPDPWFDLTVPKISSTHSVQVHPLRCVCVTSVPYTVGKYLVASVLVTSLCYYHSTAVDRGVRTPRTLLYSTD